MKARTKSTGRMSPVNTDGHVIGLDIGATSVRATVLALSDKGGTRPVVTVHGVGSMPLPRGAVVNGAVMEPAVVTEALQALWAANALKCRRVILGTANPQVVVRPLQIPDLKPEQRAKALPFQARELIALPLHEVVLDYAQAGAADPKSGLVSGLLIATPRLPVLAAVQAVEKAGLRVVRVDLSSFGALRALADETLAVQAVVDMGAHLTSIVIHHHGVPKLVRTVARGGQELTDLLVENLGIPVEEAERIKCGTGLTGGDAAAEILQTGLRPLLAEIRSSVNYFRSGNTGATLEAIVLAGGASALPGLAGAVSRHIGISAEIGSPMRHLNDDGPPKGGPAGQYATAVSVGLALGAAA